MLPLLMDNVNTVLTFVRAQAPHVSASKYPQRWPQVQGQQDGLEVFQASVAKMSGISQCACVQVAQPQEVQIPAHSERASPATSSLRYCSER